MKLGQTVDFTQSFQNVQRHAVENTEGCYMQIRPGRHETGMCPCKLDMFKLERKTKKSEKRSQNTSTAPWCLAAVQVINPTPMLAWKNQASFSW